MGILVFDMKANIKLSNISKHFNHIIALDNVSLEAFKGEVLALVGENGAGKSTLIKILSGVLKPDNGLIEIDGKTYTHLTVSEALELGISTVYQDLALGDSMDVASNIFLGSEITKHGLLDKKAMHRQTAELLKRLKINIPDTKVNVGNLSGGQRQGVAVARLVNRGGNILIFDEPTAAMGINESNRTLELIRHLADEGFTVIMISHNLMQVFQVADRIVVLRHGCALLEEKVEDISMKEVVELLTSADIYNNKNKRNEI